MTPSACVTLDIGIGDKNRRCDGCLFLRTPIRAPYRTPSACVTLDIGIGDKNRRDLYRQSKLRTLAPSLSRCLSPPATNKAVGRVGACSSIHSLKRLKKCGPGSLQDGVAQGYFDTALGLRPLHSRRG